MKIALWLLRLSVWLLIPLPAIAQEGVEFVMVAGSLPREQPREQVNPPSTLPAIAREGVEFVMVAGSSGNKALNPPPPKTAPLPHRRPVPVRPDHAPPDLFGGGSNSLVARAVGHAEGTRSADGGKTNAYQGHTDPGNGVWNQGTFSFQHCRDYGCKSAEDADRHQLNRLRGQAEELRQRAALLGIDLTLEEELNGIDLANQAPLAALGLPEAYPEQLARARQQGLTGQAAILEGRVWSYWADGRWQAPGLGNTEANIRHDQNRRMQAIANVLAELTAQQRRRVL